MNRATIFLLLPAAVACGLRELGETVPEAPLPDYIDTFRSSTVVTGIAYPDGSGWGSSGAPSSSDVPEIVMYRDGELVLSIPVKAENFVPEDVDMQHYSGGHIYTDFSTDSETIVARDGVELFRYAGRERIVFLAENDGGRVLTLGESRSGKGFSSRADGVPVFLGLDGTVYPNAGLSPDGELRFFYTVGINSTAGKVQQHYAVTGTENIRIELPPEVRSVYGFAFPPSSPPDSGEGLTALCRCRNEYGKYVPCLVDISDGSFTELPGLLNKSPRIYGAAVLENAAPLLASCSCQDRGLLPLSYTCVFSGQSRPALWLQDNIPLGFRHCADSVAGVQKSMSGEGRDVLCNGYRRDTLPAGYTVMAGDALCCAPGGLKVGLTSRNGGRAILWNGGRIDSLGFRGIVTGVFEERTWEGDSHAY